MTVPWGPSVLIPCLEGWIEGAAVVLSGISSGHMDHGIHETDGFMALRLSKLIGSKESSNHAKFPLQTTHLLFSKVPFTESSGELCYF